MSKLGSLSYVCVSCWIELRVVVVRQCWLNARTSSHCIEVSIYLQTCWQKTVNTRSTRSSSPKSGQHFDMSVMVLHLPRKHLGNIQAFMKLLEVPERHRNRSAKWLQFGFYIMCSCCYVLRIIPAETRLIVYRLYKFSGIENA